MVAAGYGHGVRSPRPASRARLAAGLVATVALALTPAHSSAQSPAVAVPAPTAVSALDQGAQPAQRLSAVRPALKANAPAKVAKGTRFTIKGKVARGSGRRKVTVSERVGGRQRTLASAKTNRKGRFSIQVKAGSKTGQRSLRVLATKGGRTLASTTVRVRVTAESSPPSAATSVTANWSAATTPLGTPLQVTGAVVDAEESTRTVVLEQRYEDGWGTVGEATTALDGSFALVAPSDWLYSTQMRVVAPATAASAEGASAATVVTTTPTWSPAGSPADWIGLAGSGDRFRWNPCQVVTYRTNFTLAPAEARVSLDQALAQVTRATGVRFQHVGETTAVFDGAAGHRSYEAGTNLFIGWAPPSHTLSPLNGSTIGYGGIMTSKWAKDARGTLWRATTGGLVLNSEYAGWTTSMQVEMLMHELGHAVGLGHANGEPQIMYPIINGARLAWGAGDLTGFRGLGRQTGCTKVAARPVGARVPEGPMVAAP